MTWIIATCVASAALGLVVLAGWRLAQTDKVELPEPGEPLRPQQVEDLALACSSMPEVVQLAVDWSRLYRQHKRDVALLNTEIDDLRRRIPDDQLSGVAIASSDYINAEVLAERAFAAFRAHNGLAEAPIEEFEPDVRAAWLAVVGAVRP